MTRALEDEHGRTRIFLGILLRFEIKMVVQLTTWIELCTTARALQSLVLLESHLELAHTTNYEGNTGGTARANGILFHCMCLAFIVARVAGVIAITTPEPECYYIQR